jgi:hypothetical protein
MLRRVSDILYNNAVVFWLTVILNCKSMMVAFGVHYYDNWQWLLYFILIIHYILCLVVYLWMLPET